MEAMIKKGALIGQDFGVREWGNDQTVFKVDNENINGRRRCTADGYGSFVAGEKYGNGAVYVKENDLIPVEYCPTCGSAYTRTERG